jgi:hypothetical protein
MPKFTYFCANLGSFCGFNPLFAGFRRKNTIPKLVAKRLLGQPFKNIPPYFQYYINSIQI